jgi:hypothetical protein
MKYFYQLVVIGLLFSVLFARGLEPTLFAFEPRKHICQLQPKQPLEVREDAQWAGH